MRKPPPDAVDEAKANPGGWVYAIDGRYDRNGDIPPEAIEGAWQVDDSGVIVGDFIPNPNYVLNHPIRQGWRHGDGLA